MRDVVLVPEHSQWWLLSPGVTLYYDRLLIHNKDYEEVMNAAGKSSYHAQVAQHLDALVRQGEEPYIEVVKDLRGLGDDYHNRGELIRDKLYALAGNPHNPAISPKEIVRLTFDAFSHWFSHNERKVKYLRKDEPYRKFLESELLGEWKSRQNALGKMLLLPDNDALQAFQVESALLKPRA
jgi:hypothetical protein